MVCSASFIIYIDFTHWAFQLENIPIPSMYGIFTYIWLILVANVGKYTIHGWCGIVYRLKMEISSHPFILQPFLPTAAHLGLNVFVVMSLGAWSRNHGSLDGFIDAIISLESWRIKGCWLINFFGSYKYDISVLGMIIVNICNHRMVRFVGYNEPAEQWKLQPQWFSLL